MYLFGNKQKSYLGVDIGSDGIKFVELKDNNGRPQLWTYGIAKQAVNIHADALMEKNPNDLLKEKDSPFADKKQKSENIEQKILSDNNKVQISKYAKLIKEVIEQSKAVSKTVIASIPVSYVFHTVLNMPAEAKDSAASIANAEVAKFLSRPAEEMQIISQIIPQTDAEKSKKYIRVLVTAAPKTVVAFYTAIFQEAGLQLIELETEAFALERSLVGKDSNTSMVVDIGAERSNFFIIDQGLPITHRSIQVGGNNFIDIISKTLGVDREMAALLKKDIARLNPNKLSADIFDDLLDSVVKEIQYNFDVFLHQIGNEEKRPEKIILTGGSCVMPAIIERLKKEFPLKVFVGDPWARVVYQQKLKTVLNSNAPRMSVCIGLALRNIVS